MTNPWPSLVLLCRLDGVAPLAQANEWDKHTVVTFHESIQILGMVLPAGTYIMRLVDSSIDLPIVQYLN